eukprot:COSAG01_NODE_38452_length_489_cov_1.089744_1_plen_143_part_00
MFAARDMNLLFTANTLSQTVLTAMAGQMFDAFESPSAAYRACFIAAAAALVCAVGLLPWINKKNASVIVGDSVANAKVKAGIRGLIDHCDDVTRSQVFKDSIPRRSSQQEGGGDGGWGAQLCDRLLFGVIEANHMRQQRTSW